jgi:hypothetical protein
MHPNLQTTSSAEMLPAPPTAPASQSRTINVDSTYGLNAIATTRYLQFYSAINRADHITVLLLPALKANRNPSNPHLSPLVSLRRIEHRQITIWVYVIHCYVHSAWKAVEQLAAIDMQTNVSESTQELLQQGDTLDKACGFQQISYHPKDIVRDEDIVFGNMVLYVEMMQAPDTANDQRACIDSALYSPPVQFGLL